MSWLEWAAVGFSLLGVVLTARRSMACWPVNLIACALYFRLFFDVRLYADMGLQALFGAAVVYGWVLWARGRGDHGPIAIVPLARAAALRDLACGAAAALAIGWFTSHYTDAALPWVDAALTGFSLVGQYWTARRHVANWPLWMIVDCAYVGMYLAKGLWLTAALYALFVMLAALGWRAWRRAASR